MIKIKLSATYAPETDLLVLRFDDDVQKLFAKGSRTLTSLLGQGGPPSALENDADWYEDIGLPLMILERLGTEPTQTVRVRPEHLYSLMGLVCWTTLHLADNQQPVDTFRDVVSLLASVTPVPIPPVDLPPTDEVLDRKNQSAAWSCFEMLRSWQRQEFPELPVIQAHNLWVELRRIRKPNGQIKTLLATLDTETIMFRWAMEALAIKEISGAPRRKRKK